MIRIIFVVIMLVCLCNVCNAVQFLNKIEIEGKIVDQNGSLITDEVILTAELESFDYPIFWDPKAKNFEEQIKTDVKTLEKKVYGGTFTWNLPDANTCDIKASKEGYHGDLIGLTGLQAEDKIIVKDLIVHLIKKGTPSKLEYVESAEIPSKK